MLNVDVCGVDFKNPLIMASGTFGFGREHSEFFDLSSLGGICTKGLTLNAKAGNDGIRVYETPSGMLNSVGLQNPGVVKFIEAELPWMLQQNTVIIANLGGGCEEDYARGIELLNQTQVDMIELNISCPNVKHGGMAFGIKSATAYSVVHEMKSICEKPLMVKLSPNAEDIVDMAVKCVEAGADALSLVNTFKGMAVDIRTKSPVFENVTAGLSGPAIKPIALRMVYEVCGNVDVPVIGIGGIMSWQDVVEFLMCGAHAVQIGTGNLIKPDISVDILAGLNAYMEREGIENINEIRGIIRR